MIMTMMPLPVNGISPPPLINGGSMRCRYKQYKGGVMVFFFGQHESWNIYFFVAQFFSPELYDTKIRIFFSATLEVRIFFIEKKHNSPPCKLNYQSLIRCTFRISRWKRICFCIVTKKKTITPPCKLNGRSLMS
jgi:hypothetical protein